ncbi:hypothetical protein SPHINGO8BC_150529 [Sphingobacterium multivorum]|uniref:Uncharacterized protein n=1 Tax=Sphingobacterium multivorum TaxID=28454 RepID=A0A654ART6_SPHMU|nr:hypothetical protein SPHINGO8BC_150529 [Sphingobacterium multivorum]
MDIYFSQKYKVVLSITQEDVIFQLDTSFQYMPFSFLIF